MSYHNGSVWPHDNALIALGLARYGFNAARGQCASQGMFDAAAYMELLPAAGIVLRLSAARQRQAPTLYPVACAPQAWASAAPFALIQASLGLTFDAASQRIALKGAALPQFLDMLVLSNVRLGEASADFGLYRSGETVSLEIFRNADNLDIAIEK